MACVPAACSSIDGNATVDNTDPTSYDPHREVVADAVARGSAVALDALRVADCTTTELARRALDKLAEHLRGDAAERDRAGAEPTREVALLKESGLLTPADPRRPRRAGESWLAANQVTRIVAAADANVGHLLGYHYLQLWRGELFDRPDLVTRLQRETVTGNHFWAGVSNPLDAALELTPVDGGFRVNGRKTFATGASVADRLVVSATRTDNDEKLTFALDGKARGIRYLGDWDNIGQRLTASGGVEFTDVFVPADDVLGVQPDEHQPPRLSLAAIGVPAVPHPDLRRHRGGRAHRGRRLHPAPQPPLVHCPEWTVRPTTRTSSRATASWSPRCGRPAR